MQNTNARSKSISKTADATYQYQVRACNALSCSSWTGTKSVTVLKTPGVPGAIQGPLTSTGAYTLTWGAAAGTVATYQLQEKIGTGTWSTVQNTSARSKDFSKSAENTYSYQVRACNRLSCGDFTSAKAIEVALSPPPVPSPFTVPSFDQDGAYSISWGSSTGATSYELQERANSLDATAWTGITLDSDDDTSADLTGKANGAYHYRVRACKGTTLCSDWTEPKITAVLRLGMTVTVTPDPAPQGSYTVSWTSSSPAQFYLLEESSDNKASWKQFSNHYTLREQSFSGKAKGVYWYRVVGCFIAYEIGGRLCPFQGAAEDVTVPNRAPAAAADNWATTRNQAVTIDVLANDTDSDGDALTVRSATDPANGTATVNSDGAVIYTPDAGFVGSDTFDYSVSDGDANAEGTATATVTVTVANQAPAAKPDEVSTFRGTEASIEVLANDSDPDGDALTVQTSTTAPSNGTTTVKADGTITYAPTAGFAGEDTFEYSISDGRDTADATVTVTVENRAPKPQGDAAQTVHGGTVTIEVLANDTDPDGDALSVVSATDPATGTATVNAEGTVTYTPDADAGESEEFEYRVTDGTDTASATVTVTIRANGAPVAVDDTAQTTRNQAVSIKVLTNDADPDGDALTVQSPTTDPAKGTTVVNADGTITYTPNAGAAGRDSFDYTITDGVAENSATVTVDVINRDPEPVDDRAETRLNQAVSIQVLANDTDPDGDALTVQPATTGPANGTATVNADGTITYTPRTGYTGTDSFDYTISDGSATATATVTVTVNPTAPAGPVANDDNAETTRNRAVAINVLANDFDPDGDALTVQSSTTTPANGTTTVNADGTITYTPTTGFVGTDSFDYTVSDGLASASAAVTVQVTNAAPCAVDDRAQTTRNQAVTVEVLANDCDPDGDALTVQTATAPTNGTATINADGTIAYTPNAGFAATDTFDYTITDGGATDTATVTVLVANRAPVAVGDEATTSRASQATIDVLGNDADPDGDALTVRSATAPDNGAVTVNSDGTIAYTPDDNFAGTDTFDYTITDALATASATVTVTVENQPPVAGPDSASTTANTAVTIEVLANDVDPDGDALSVSSATDPDNGSVTVNADGTIAYTPDAAFTGIDRFTYRISDGIASATGQVTVAVGGYTVETPPAPYDAPLSLVTAAERRDIDETGTMPGAFRVTESGAASYTMPIHAVPGTAGVTPELALTYNSQAGNGVAGLGWTIDGVSAIVRCRATRHQDAAAKPIQWNDQDRFCLDGQRLVLDSGTYGAPNATYRTEIDSFARIKALGGTAGHPDYFEVSGKDGSKRHYGNVPGGAHTDAKQRNGASQTLKWALKRFEDNIGNPIWYLYANDADGHRLTGVRYAYGAERAIGDHHAWIEFVYEDREDDATGYVAGHAFASRKRLDKVRTHNHHGTALTLLREIRLSYRDVRSSLDKTSRLTQVQECTGSAPTAPCLPATTFTWPTATAGFKATASGQTDLTPRDDRGILNHQPADVNGDGNLDLVWLEWDRDGASDTDHHLRYALSDGTKLTAATFAGGGASIELYEDVERAQTVKMHVIDYNGDGRSDVILWRSRDPVWKVYLSTPQPTGGWKLTATPLWTPVANSTASFTDLSGDGLVDAVYTRGLTVRARYLERDSTQTDASSRRYKFGAEMVLLTVEQHMEGTIPVPLASSSVTAANYEFNGDGRADLIVSAHFKDDVGVGGDLFDHTDQGPYVADADGNWTRIANFGEAELHPADLNLDGLTDLIRLVGSRVHVEINTGAGFVSSSTGITLDRNEVTVMEPMDYNGDGHPDFIWHDRDAERIKAYLWNPNTNAFDTATARTVRSTDGNRKRAHLFFDANGDGHTDYLHLTKLSTKGRLSTYLANNDGKTPRQVTAVTNGLGAVTEIDYETLSRTDHYERLGLGGSATTAQFCYTFMGASGCHPYTRTTVNQANINAFYADLNGGWNLPSGAHTLGKAGPVLEFTGPVPVVTRVDGSAPKAGRRAGRGGRQRHQRRRVLLRRGQGAGHGPRAARLPAAQDEGHADRGRDHHDLPAGLPVHRIAGLDQGGTAGDGRRAGPRGPSGDHEGGAAPAERVGHHLEAQGIPKRLGADGTDLRHCGGGCVPALRGPGRRENLRSQRRHQHGADAAGHGDHRQRAGRPRQRHLGHGHHGRRRRDVQDGDREHLRADRGGPAQRPADQHGGDHRPGPERRRRAGRLGAGRAAQRLQLLRPDAGRLPGDQRGPRRHAVPGDRRADPREAQGHHDPLVRRVRQPHPVEGGLL